MESAHQSVTDLALSSVATESPGSTDGDVPDLEHEVTIYRPPGVYQPRLPHSLIDLGMDSSAPGRNANE